jgi:hypothetical protein
MRSLAETPVNTGLLAEKLRLCRSEKRGDFSLGKSTTELAKMTGRFVYLFTCRSAPEVTDLGKKYTMDDRLMSFPNNDLSNQIPRPFTRNQQAAGQARHRTCLTSSVAAGLPSTLIHTITPRPFPRTQAGGCRWKRGPPDLREPRPWGRLSKKRTCYSAKRAANFN